MNSLNRDIEVGERVVVKKEVMRNEYQDLSERIFIAESGFGMHPFTAGGKVFGYYEKDNEKTYIRGEHISVEETNEIQRYKRDIPLDKLIELVTQ